jgi:23S rRNA pseudouridine1911/1915/1917 synthase
MSISIAYNDDWLLVADKPSGLLVIPTPKKEPRTLTTILNEEINKNTSYQLHPCHRLDRETSGLVIYAKGKSVQAKMMDCFKQRKVKKTYMAFVHGLVRQNSGEIRRPVEGQNAITQYRVVTRFTDYSLLEVTPLTGRTNQIRIHFKSIGHPLVGEDKFIFRKDYKLKANRICLHAQSLEFVHPITGKNIKIYSKLPLYLEKFKKQHS